MRNKNYYQFINELVECKPDERAILIDTEDEAQTIFSQSSRRLPKMKTNYQVINMNIVGMGIIITAH